MKLHAFAMGVSIEITPITYILHIFQNAIWHNIITRTNFKLSSQNFPYDCSYDQGGLKIEAVGQNRQSG